MKFVVWKAHHLETRAIIDDYVARVRAHLSGHEFVICEDEESTKREIADADVMIGWRVTPEVFVEARKLKWIQFGSAGIDHTLFPGLVDSDVILTTLSGIHTVPVAQHVLAQMLGLARRFDIAISRQAGHIYERAEIAATSEELFDKTVGIVGLGKIGLGVARLAKAFGMRVVGTKRHVDGVPPDVDEVYPPDELYKVLPQSDFLILVAPLTSGTQALIGKREMELMPDGAYLVNVARGAMIDHEALGEALGSGKLRGAALDVFPQEPLPPDSPIFDLPNVILTPHTAGSSPRYGERGAEVFKRNLDAFLAGEPLPTAYDRARGY